MVTYKTVYFVNKIYHTRPEDRREETMPENDFAILHGTAARLHGMFARGARTPVTGHAAVFPFLSCAGRSQ